MTRQSLGGPILNGTLQKDGQSTLKPVHQQGFSFGFPSKPATRNVIAAVVGFVCSILLIDTPSFGQSPLSGTSLIVSGTTTLNALEVSGIPDFQNNMLFFGTSGSNSALNIAYDDGADGVDSSITLQSTRPSSVWNWQRLTALGTSASVMQIDASNRLILTGTAENTPPILVLDPNGSVSLNGSDLLTQAAADSLYLSASAGVFASNGYIGIGIS